MCIRDRYMLGEKLLVAPVFSEDGVASYYLPQGDVYKRQVEEYNSRNK